MLYQRCSMHWALPVLQSTSAFKDAFPLTGASNFTVRGVAKSVVVKPKLVLDAQALGAYVGGSL